MADQGWGPGGPIRRDGWGRPIGPFPPRRPVPGGRDRSSPSGEWDGLPDGGLDEPVYSGPQYPREMAGYAARRDPTDPRGYRNGVRMAVPAKRWELADGLPTVPTLLVAGGAVVLAFLLGHVTGGSGGSSVAATTPTTAGVTVTTSTVPSTHTVAVGESLGSIATSFGLTTQDLASFNNITNINHVFVGEVLKIPTPTTLPATPPTTKKR